MDKVQEARVSVLEIIGNAIVGGMESYVARLVTGLPPERFSVVCLCPFESRFTAALRDAGAEVYIAPMTDDPNWHTLQIACTLIKTRSVDIVHAHLSNAHTLAGIVGKLTGKPVLATIHGRTLPLNDLEVHRLTGTHLSVVCRYAYFHALGLGVNPTQLHLISNGIDTDLFSPSHANRYLRERLNLPASTPLVGFVGRLAPEKGPEVFLRTALLVRAARPDAQFVMIGEGPLSETLQASVRTLGLASVVHMVGVQTNMPDAFCSLDLMVLSSHSEGMPLALMEAMACGLPVVATHVGGVPEILENGASGVLAQPSDHESLARAVIALLAEPALMAAMGREARVRIQSQFSLMESVSAMSELLAKIPQRTERNTERRISAVSGVPKSPASGAQNGLKTATVSVKPL